MRQQNTDKPMRMKTRKLTALLVITAALLLALPAVAQSGTVTRHAFTAKFQKSKIVVSIWFEESDEGDLSGEIVYTSSKKQTPFRIFGSVVDLPGNQRVYSLSEYQADGSISGTFHIKRNLTDGRLTGKWSDMGFGSKQRTYTMRLATAAFPQGKGGTFAAPRELSGRYCYDRVDEVKGHQGGTVEINRLRGSTEKMEVNITKNDPNIAEFRECLFYRNGVFKGSLSDCGYSFTVQVFSDFVRVRTTSPTDRSYDCFGAFTTLDGFYLRVAD